MCKSSFLLIVFILLISDGIAQEAIFQKTFSSQGYDQAYSMLTQNQLGELLIAGTASNSNSASPLLLKTDQLGNFSWAHLYNTLGRGTAYAVEATLDSGYVVAGSTGPNGLVESDLYQMKTDSMGNLVWFRTFGDLNIEHAWDVIATSDGGYAIVGVKYRGSQPAMLIIKTDALGNLTWSQVIHESLGEVSYSVCEAIDGGLVLTGYTSTFGAGIYDIAIIKLNPLGQITWKYIYGGPAVEMGFYILPHSTGYYITGTTISYGAGGADIVLMKIDLQGNLLWFKTYGAEGQDYGTQLLVTSDQKLAIVGYGTSYSDSAGIEDGYFLHTDLDGNVEWFKVYGGKDYDRLMAVKEMPKGGFVIAGYSGSFDTAGYHDIYLLRTDDFGNCGCNQLDTIPQSSAHTPVIDSPNWLSEPLQQSIPPTVTVLDTLLEEKVLCFSCNANLKLSSDTLICAGDSAQLSASGGVQYSWSGTAPIEDPGGSEQTVSPATPSSYFVTMTDAFGCIDQDTVLVDVHYPILELSEDTSVFEGDHVQLFAAGGLTYLWSPNSGLDCSDCSSPVATPTRSTTYQVEMTDSVGCSQGGSVTITIEKICENIYIPSAFTPNGDGINDEFKVVGEAVELEYFSVYDRWGGLIFQTNNPSQGWNGDFKGQPVPNGVYTYDLSAYCNGKLPVFRKGKIILTR